MGMRKRLLIGGAALSTALGAVTGAFLTQDDELLNYIFTGDEVLARELAMADISDELKGEAGHDIEIAGENTDLYVLLPGWGANEPQEKLRDRLLDAGNSVMNYHVDTSLLSTDISGTVDAFNRLENQVREDISSTVAAYDFNDVCVVGTSLGSVAALMVCEYNSDVDYVTLIVPGASIAETLWSSIRLEHYKEAMQNEGVSLESLSTYWSEIEPMNNISGLNGKGLKIFLSKDDKIIPYEQGRGLVDAMENSGYDVQLVENDVLGHFLTCGWVYNVTKTSELKPNDVEISASAN